jgi:hypothetical protein
MRSDLASMNSMSKKACPCSMTERGLPLFFSLFITPPVNYLAPALSLVWGGAPTFPK